MARTKKEALEDLAKYSKEEIIEALGKSYLSTGDIDYILIDLNYIRQTKTIDEHQKAAADASAALTAYIEWQKEVIEKYGDGKTVRFIQLPASEIKRGNGLADALDAANKKEKRLDNKVKKLLNL